MPKPKAKIQQPVISLQVFQTGTNLFRAHLRIQTGTLEFESWFPSCDTDVAAFNHAVAEFTMALASVEPLLLALQTAQDDL